MIEFTYTIRDPLGIHARPAGLLAREASNFDSSITMIKGGKSANVKGLLSLMSLIVKNGDTVTVSVSGSDEKEAARKLQDYLEEHL